MNISELIHKAHTTAKDAGVSNTQLSKQAGNSIVVPMLESIFRRVFEGSAHKKEDSEGLSKGGYEMAEINTDEIVDKAFMKALGVDYEYVLEAIKEKQERDNVKQWLEDMGNPLEPIKIEAALRSEIMKMNFRKEHKPKEISVLDYTVIAVLTKALETTEV